MTMRACLNKKNLSLIAKLTIFIIFILDITSVHVYAQGGQIIKTEAIEENPDEIKDKYDIRIRYQFSNKGRSFRNFDVSKENKVVMAFTNHTIGIFDEKMQLEAEISFSSDGAYGALWNDDKVMLYLLRSQTAIAFSDAGEILGIYRIVDEGNYWYEAMEQQSKTVNDTIYYGTFHHSSRVPIFNWGSYTVLRKIDGEINHSTLYEGDNRVDGYLLCIVISFAIMTSLILFFLFLYKRYRMILKSVN